MATEEELRTFAELYALAVPYEQRQKTVKAVRELREEEWREALEQANGDKNKACDILFSKWS